MSVRIVSLQAKLGLDGTGFQQNLRKAGQQAQQFASGLKGQLAGAFSAAAVTAFAKHFIDLGGQIADMSKKLNISTSDFQALSYAIKQAGGDSGDLQAVFRGLAKAREEALAGDEAKMSAFSDLGLGKAAVDAGNLAEMLKTIGDTIKSTDFGASEEPLLERVLGRGAMEMIPVFKAGLRELAEEAQRIGVILGDDVVRDLDAAGDKMDQLSARFKVMFAPLVSFVAAMVDALDIMFGGIGAFAGGALNTPGGPLEKMKGGADAVTAHNKDILDRRKAESGAVETPTNRARATPSKPVTAESASEAAIREANGRALRALPMGPISPSEIYNKSKQGSSDRFGFASNKDLEKMSNGEVLTLQKDIARSSARMQELLEQINQRAQRTTKSGPFGSQ